jgi:phosphatidylserine/phosphatidylglycerophosphate/cardiolipin synthase-like enzyme
MSDPDLITIYQHRAKSGVDRYYWDSQVPNVYGWGDGVQVFQAYATEAASTVPLYRHEAGSPDRYYIDTSFKNSYGWSDGVVVCYAYTTQQAGTIPIYRHEASAPYRYYLDTQIPNNYGWSQGALLCYAHPAATTLIDSIVGVLGWQGANYKGVTYQASPDGKFTLHDTPRVWNTTGPVTFPTAACTEILQAITDTVASAKTLLDITLLWQTGTGLPGGGFQAALAKGFKSLNGAKASPLVRIMIGVPLGPWVFDKDLTAWLDATLKMSGASGNEVSFTVQIGCCKQSPESWNHAKVIAADGRRAVVGGHNLWAVDYLGDHPIHDVSGLIEGQVVTCAHNFSDKLWTDPSAIPEVAVLKNGSYHYGTQERRPTGFPPPPTGGTTRMLALGRLGYGLAKEFSMATNASVSARLIALCSATKQIRVSQQSLYFTATHLDGGYDFYTLWALVKAMEAGVTVQIVLSNDVPLSEGGYAGNLPTCLTALTSLYIADRMGVYRPRANPRREDGFGWAEAGLTCPQAGLPVTVSRVPTPSEYKPYLTELQSKLSVALLYYAPNRNYWQTKAKKIPAGNHAKVYIIDDTHFYVGSDNLYLSGTSHGLQEYGHLIEGQTETRKFIADYWDKLWQNSSQHVVAPGAPSFASATPPYWPPAEVAATALPGGG